MRIPPFQIERFFAAHEFTTPHLLCVSDCEAMSVADLLAFEPGAAEGLNGLWLGYTESPGAPELWAAVAGLYDRVGADDVQIYTGAEEAIFGFANAVLDAGDHVVVHTPCYQSLIEVARAVGCTVSPWRAREDRGWAPDLDELEKLIRPDTRAVIVNLPHNPTGYLMPRADFDRLIDIVRDRGVVLICDEVYRYIEHDPADRLSPIRRRRRHRAVVPRPDRKEGCPDRAGQQLRR